MKNSFTILHGSHGLVVSLCKLAHSVTVTGVKNNRFHNCKAPFDFLCQFSFSLRDTHANYYIENHLFVNIFSETK